MKSKKKIIQKTNIKINIGGSALKKPRRRRRGPTKPKAPIPSSYQHYPMYTVQQGNNLNVGDVTKLIQDSNEMNIKQFTKLLKDQEEKKEEFRIPPEYLKLNDLQNYYNSFSQNLPNIIKDVVSEIEIPKTTRVKKKVKKAVLGPTIVDMLPEPTNPVYGPVKLEPQDKTFEPMTLQEEFDNIILKYEDMKQMGASETKREEPIVEAVEPTPITKKGPTPIKRTYKPDKKVKCEYCGAVFSKKANLVRHQIRSCPVLNKK